MRNLEEIDKNIKGIDEKINALNEQRRTLVNERSEREFADFCEKYDVKKGDVVHIDRCGDVIIEGMDKTWSGGWIVVRKIKKNGEPYKSVEHELASMFEGCKVIGHIDDKTKED